MKTFITLNNKRKRKLPKKFRINDNRNPESIVKYFLIQYTKKGDNVFDPFAGLGTTLLVSENMNRIPYGIEYDKKRFDYIKSQLKRKYRKNIIQGDSLKLNSYGLPKMDFCFTSPPYGVKNMKYQNYLNNIRNIFKKVKNILKINSYLIIEVSNLKGKEVTTLAWDIAKEVSNLFRFEGEIIIGWKGKDTYGFGGTYGYGYDHSYCLIFKRKK